MKNITLNSIGQSEMNVNATYEIGVVNPDSFQIIATSDRGFKVTATIEGDAITWLREDE